jgi:hypothetical protein
MTTEDRAAALGARLEHDRLHRAHKHGDCDLCYPAAAMPDECTCGGEPMTDPTAAERIADAMAGRAETIRTLQDEAAAFDEDGYPVTDEEKVDRLYEMPLSVEVIRHVKILLGTGGPADWLDAELDEDGEISTLAYHFADWGTHSSVYVEKGSPLWRFVESFTANAIVDATEAAY